VPRRERPLDSAHIPLARFAADLRALRREAGTPTYREMAARSHYSVSTLSEAAGGRRLPTLGVMRAYVTACGGDPVEWTRRWHDLAAALAADAAPPDDEQPSPYAGLAAFQTEDAERFFGREALVAEVLRRLRDRPLVAVLARPVPASRRCCVRAWRPGCRPPPCCSPRAPIRSRSARWRSRARPG